MPSETHYLPADLQRYVEQVRDGEDMENNSQALQLIVDEHRGQNDE